MTGPTVEEDAVMQPNGMCFTSINSCENDFTVTPSVKKKKLNRIQSLTDPGFHAGKNKTLAFDVTWKRESSDRAQQALPPDGEAHALQPSGLRSDWGP